MRVLICGAGVGGLSAGIALQRVGFDVVVFERAHELRTTGAGLNLWPNAGRALYALGLQREYDEVAVMLRRYLTLSSSGETLYEREVDDWPEKYGAPATGVYRRDLSSMLVEALGRDRIVLGHELTDIDDDGVSVECAFANGQTYSGEALVGADGIHSTTRACLYGPLNYRENQHHADRWRGLFRLADSSVDPWAETEVFGDHSFFGTMPIGSGFAYWFASGPGIGGYEDFMARFGSWNRSHVPSTIAATPREEILRTKLYDLSEMPERWTQGGVTLLGDAAHPMMPDMAQGASQTFVDSKVLGESLAESTDVRKGLQMYEQRRRPDAYNAVSLSRRGMFANTGQEPDGKVVDPIALRYERDIEGGIE